MTNNQAEENNQTNQTEEKLNLLSVLVGRAFTETEKKELEETLFMLEEWSSYSPYNISTLR